MNANPLALVVEDDPQQSEIFSQALKQAGYVVEACSDGQKTLDHLANATPHIVVLDLNLPTVSGDQILAYIRSEPRLETIRVILATANPRQAELLRGDSDLVLIKPISFTQLKTLAERLHPER